MSQNPSGAVHPTTFMILWVLAGFGGTRLWPLPSVHPLLISVGGKLLWGVGGIILLWAQLEFWRHKTTTSHSNPTTAIITRGPFRFSRHPTYVGLIALMLGIALLYDSTWSLVLMLPVIVAIHRLTVVREEAYLAREFGETYSEYTRTVRRWL